MSVSRERSGDSLAAMRRWGGDRSIARSCPRTRGVLTGVLLLALSVAACTEQSKVAADAPVRISGMVRDTTGAPLVDRPVRLGAGVTTLEGGLGVLTAGIFCLSGACSGDAFDTTTAADGTYALELTGEDTQSAFGEATSFLLSASGAPDAAHPTGPAVGGRFRVQTEDLTLPPLQLVDPRPRLSSTDAHAVLEWDPTAAPGPFEVQFVDVDDERVVWAVSSPGAEAQVDGRVLEDALGRVTVGGSSKDAVEGSDLHLSWVSPSLAFGGGFGAPPSRGAACEAIAADGTSSPMAPCPLTDGSFASTTTLTNLVRTTLPSPIPADLVVVRGCATTCRVWVTPEGAPAPVEVSAASGPFAAIVVDGAPLVAVDVELPSDGVASLAEVSVWAPAAAEATPLRDVEDPSAVAGELGADDDSGGRGWWSVIAGGLILITVLALGVAVGRAGSRRRAA